MRPFELLTLLANFPMVAWPFHWREKRRQWELFLPAAGLPAALIQLILEGYRWQMIPAYALTMGGAVLAIWLLNNKEAAAGDLRTKWGIVATIGALSYLLLALSAIFCIILPVPKIPLPTGGYQVGTVSYYWVDQSRMEIYGEEQNAKRELVAQVWYPAGDTQNSQHAQAINGVEEFYPLMASYANLAPVVLSHLHLAKSNAYLDVPLASDQPSFPVILFSHGWFGFKEQNIYQMEELASKGYIVVAISHTYGAIGTVFPDGHIALHDPNTLSSEGEERDAARNLLVNQWTQDLSFVLTQLESLNQNDPAGRFTGHLRLDAIGAMGHSTGGGAALLFCLQDIRCVCFLGMDTWLEPLSVETIQAGTDKPVIFMHSEEWAKERPDNNALVNEFYHALASDNYQLVIIGSSHEDFTLISLFSPVAGTMGLKGGIDGERAFAIINAYTLAFFDQYLKGEHQPLLEGFSSVFPEATLTISAP